MRPDDLGLASQAIAYRRFATVEKSLMSFEERRYFHVKITVHRPAFEEDKCIAHVDVAW